MLIRKNTLSTIETRENGKALLRMYNNGKIIFEKEYNTFRGAQKAEAYYLKRLPR